MTQKTKPAPNLIYGKVPPQAPETEDAILGVLLYEPYRIDSVVSILHSNCFYKSENATIYDSILALHNRGMAIDTITVTNELRNRGELDRVGGEYYLGTLVVKAVSGANLEQHCYIVKEKYLEREHIRIAGEAINRSYAGDQDTFDNIEKTQADLYKLTTMNIRKDVTHVSKSVKEVLDETEERRRLKIEMTGIPTGNSEMDSCTSGWQPSDFIILAARPAMGKTAYALSTSLYAAVKCRKPVAFFSLEMKNTQLTKRMVSAMSGVDFKKVLNPVRLSDDELKRVQESASLLANSPLFLDESHGITAAEIRTKSRRLKEKHNIQMIVIDYLQLVKGNIGDKSNRDAELADICRDLKGLGKELDIPVIALCQLNRAVEGRQVKTYKLSDLRESGSIEQEADLVMFLHSPSSEDFKNKNEPHLQVGGVYIEKHRNGECKKIAYQFNKNIQRWEEYDHIKFESYKKAEGVQPSQSQNETPVEDLPF